MIKSTHTGKTIKPNQKSVMIWAHRLLRSHGDQADIWAMEVSERHRLSKDAYGVAKWRAIAKEIGQLRASRRDVRKTDLM